MLGATPGITPENARGQRMSGIQDRSLSLAGRPSPTGINPGRIYLIVKNKWIDEHVSSGTETRTGAVRINVFLLIDEGYHWAEPKTKTQTNLTPLGCMADRKCPQRLSNDHLTPKRHGCPIGASSDVHNRWTCAGSIQRVRKPIL